MYSREIFGHELDNVYNLSEIVVIETMKKYLEAHPHICRCTVCLEDMYALALNRIPAKYLQDDYRDQYYDRMMDYKNAERETVMAIEQISANPHHSM